MFFTKVVDLMLINGPNTGRDLNDIPKIDEMYLIMNTVPQKWTAL